MIRFCVILFVSFVGMEFFSYLVHRFVYHGALWVIHKSHHTPRTGAFELNDLFPVVFATVTIVVLTVALQEPVGFDLLAAGIGISLYGAVYFVIHDLYVHRRVKSLRIRIPLLRKVKQAHAIHHRNGGEPYGLLLFADPRRSGGEGVNEEEVA